RTHEQAAHQLGLPSGSVSRHLARARELLRERLTRRGLGGQPESAAGVVPPPSLVEATAAAGWHFAAGGITGAVPRGAAALGEGVLRSMFMSKLKTVVLTLLVLGVIGLGGVLVARQVRPAGPANAPPTVRPQAMPEAPPAAVDRHGDPLPGGA